MAKDSTLSPTEKVGFPDDYRSGKDAAILDDILGKLPDLKDSGKMVLDIGPGCGTLARLLIDHCREYQHRLVLVDSEEMLGELPDASFIQKVPAYYPECPELFDRYANGFDCILSYSVLHYVFAESNIWRFVDLSLSLLSNGGRMLLGDIPNVSKRKRFFSSKTGIEFHQRFMQTQEKPELRYNVIEPDTIDDAVVLGLVSRARNQGFDAYLLPQGADLPMANRREDIVVVKP